MSDQDNLTEVAQDTSSHRKLFSYLTADVADDYIAIMRLFTGTLLTDLSAAEVAAQLRDRGIVLDPDSAEDRCKQLASALR